MKEDLRGINVATISYEVIRAKPLSNLFYRAWAYLLFQYIYNPSKSSIWSNLWKLMKKNK